MRQPELEFVARPETGRIFTSSRRVRWGDADPAGMLRLDAIARHLQDNSNDDTRDAGLDPTEPWVVRRTAVRIVEPVHVAEMATLSTWNSGQGRRWAERRTIIETETGGRIDAASLWVRIDRDTGLPARLTPEFHTVYDEAAAGRRIGSRLRLEPPPENATEVRPWPLRHRDLDGLGHVNNAATWEPIVDEIARLGGRIRYAELEYGDGIRPDETVELHSRHTTDDEGTVLDVWLLVDGGVRASAQVHLDR